MYFAGFFANTLMLMSNVITKLSSDDILVELSDGGKVRGTILRSNGGRPFYAFRGIPYAEPPVGELRFKAPVPKSSWGSTTLDATDDGPSCYHQNTNGKFVGSEDCLVLNVYTPEIPNKTNNIHKRAVMVYIHGGSFLAGDAKSTSLSPRPLMDFDIVLVIMNYRLDATGFLSTGDAASPGNYGMLDQRLALLWVKNNIEAFGGDAESVTLFGQSAGGASVSYHLLSPLSKGLFHRAISMSGSSLTPWGFQPNPLYFAKHVAKNAGCPEESTEELVSCLRSKPIEAINLGLRHYKTMSSLPVPFRPTIDGYFLPAHPKDIMNCPEKLNNVPLMTGITEAERGLAVWAPYIHEPPGTVTRKEFVQDEFNNSITNQDPKIMQLINDRYLAHINRRNDEIYARALIKALSHGLFDMNHYEEVKLLSEAGMSVYAYSFNYETECLAAIIFPFGNSLKAPNHMEDLILLFEIEIMLKPELTERDKRMAKILLRLWTNFAKSGHPDPTNQYLQPWKPSTPDVINIHNLHLELSSREYAVNEDELFHFWTKDIYLARANKTSI